MANIKPEQEDERYEEQQREIDKLIKEMEKRRADRLAGKSKTYNWQEGQKTLLQLHRSQ